MNSAFGLLAALVVLTVTSMLAFFASTRTASKPRLIHTLRVVGYVHLCLAIILFIPAVLLGQLAIGLIDHLLLFGAPLATVIFSVATVRNAKS
jgi:hypothetical protein